MISAKYVINSKIIENIISRIEKNNAKRNIFNTLRDFRNE